MTAPGNLRAVAGLVLAAVSLALLQPSTHAAEELRGLWVDTFHPALRNETEARQLVADARRAGFNALFVEVRKRGDAYYDSRFEPRASDVAPGFDPLQRLLGLAHDVAAGPRLEVHAWIVAFNIWNQQNSLPPQPDHPYRQHPDWLTRSSTGALWDGGNYAFDPGHPEVQDHTFNVAMDLVSRYEIDGLHWDYIRYAGRQWGYNPVAVARFNTRFARTGQPAPTDPDWLRFRRDQVTDLVRKVYLSAFAINPRLRISAATITFAPGITSTAQWPSSSAFSDVLQDWRAWMEEGILDLNLPMTYFRQSSHAASFSDWATFIKDHQYNRRAAIGLGAYLNPIAATFQQIAIARTPSPQGASTAGVLVYSYAAPASDISRSTALDAFTQPSPHATIPPFATPASPVAIPWKTAPATGHLKGFVLRSVEGTGIDGAAITLSGPVSRELRTDATGFFGAVDLPRGDYRVVVDAPGFQGSAADASVAGASVAHLEFPLLAVDPANPGALRITSGARGALVSWTNPAPATAWIDLRETSSTPTTPPQRVDSPTTGTRHTIALHNLTPDTSYTVRVTVRDTTTGLDAVSDLRTLRTAGTTVVDNPQARVTGGWTLATAGNRKFGPDYRIASTVRTSSIPAIATFEAALPVPGVYAVETWFPAADTRTSQAPYEVDDDTGTRSATIDQSRPPEGWAVLNPAAIHISPTNTTAVVRLRNNTGETGRTVVADAVRWRYLDTNDLAHPDHLPPWWTLHFFGADTPSPADDPDLDGLSNAAEFLTGTDPLEADSALRVDIEHGEGGGTGWRILFRPRLEGRTYELQHRGLEEPADWRTLSTNSVPAAGGAGVFSVDAGEPLPEHGLFRVRVAWPAL